MGSLGVEEGEEEVVVVGRGGLVLFWLLFRGMSLRRAAMASVLVLRVCAAWRVWSEMAVSAFIMAANWEVNSASSRTS